MTRVATGLHAIRALQELVETSLVFDSGIVSDDVRKLNFQHFRCQEYLLYYLFRFNMYLALRSVRVCIHFTRLVCSDSDSFKPLLHALNTGLAKKGAWKLLESMSSRLRGSVTFMPSKSK